MSYQVPFAKTSVENHGNLVCSCWRTLHLPLFVIDFYGKNLQLLCLKKTNISIFCNDLRDNLVLKSPDKLLKFRIQSSSQGINICIFVCYQKHAGSVSRAWLPDLKPQGLEKKKLSFTYVPYPDFITSMSSTINSQ